MNNIRQKIWSCLFLFLILSSGVSAKSTPDFSAFGSISLKEKPLKQHISDLVISQEQKNLIAVDSDENLFKDDTPGVYFISLPRALMSKIPPEQFERGSYCLAAQSIYLKDFMINEHKVTGTLTYYQPIMVTPTPRNIAEMDRMNTNAQLSSAFIIGETFTASIAKEYKTRYGPGTAETINEPGDCPDREDSTTYTSWHNPDLEVSAILMNREAFNKDCEPRRAEILVLEHARYRDQERYCDKMSREAVTKTK